MAIFGRLALLITITLSGVACRAPLETLLDDYQASLLSLLNAPLGESVNTSLLTYPSLRDRQLPMPKQHLGFGDFFDYYGCHLFFIVNQRNSVLGKVMPISRRLDYELRFLQEAAVCRRQLQQQQQLDALERLDDIIGQKHALLPSVYWNATFGSPEMAAAFSLATTPLEPTAPAGFEPSMAALSYFIALMQPQSPITANISTLEGHYQQLASHHYGGRLSLSLALVNDRLQRLNAVLETLPACPSPQHPQWQQLTAHRQAFDSFLSTLDTQGTQWLGTLKQLLALIPVTPPPAFASYYSTLLDTQAGLWQHFRDNLVRHHQLRGDWMKRCAPVLSGAN